MRARCGFLEPILDDMNTISRRRLVFVLFAGFSAAVLARRRNEPRCSTCALPRVLWDAGVDGGETCAKPGSECGDGSAGPVESGDAGTSGEGGAR